MDAAHRGRGPDGAGGLRVTALAAGPGRARALELGDGPAVVLLASPPDGAGGCRPLLEALSGRFRALALELSAPDPECAEARDAQLVLVAAAALAALEVGRAAVVGQGSSGRVAVELAVARPGLVAGLVLAAPAPLVRLQEVHVPVLLYRPGRIFEHPGLFARALTTFALRLQPETA